MNVPRLVLIFTILWPQGVLAQATTVRPPIIDMHWHASLSPGDLRSAQAVANRAQAIRRLDSLNVTHIVVNGVPDAIGVWRDEIPDRVVPALLFPCREGRAPNGGRSCFQGDQEFPDTAWLRIEILEGRIHALGEITAQYLGIAPLDLGSGPGEPSTRILPVAGLAN